MDKYALLYIDKFFTLNSCIIFELTLCISLKVKNNTELKFFFGNEFI
jgi:hypothetical protein